MLRLLRNVHFCVGNSSNAMQRHFFLRKYLNRIVLCQSVTCCVGDGMSLQEDTISEGNKSLMVIALQHVIVCTMYQAQKGML